MRKYINDCKVLGAHPILMSLTPRDAYDENDKIVRVNKTSKPGLSGSRSERWSASP